MMLEEEHGILNRRPAEILLVDDDEKVDSKCWLSFFNWNLFEHELSKWCIASVADTSIFSWEVAVSS